jgi:hypothetical protein
MVITVIIASNFVAYWLDNMLPQCETLTWNAFPGRSDLDPNPDLKYPDLNFQL